MKIVKNHTVIGKKDVRNRKQYYDELIKKFNIMITNNEFIYGTSNSNNYKKYYKFTK